MIIIKKPLIFLVLLLILAVGGGVFFYTQYQNAQAELKKLKENPNASTAEEAKKLIDKVGTLVALPQGEDPTVATITDVKKLKDQPFFLKAANGDKVLIYTQAKRAILYRPSTNKVIDIAPINIGTGSAAVTPKQNLVKVVIYNGTKTVGLTKTAEEELKGKVDNLDVVLRENANKDDYEKSVVVAISKSKDKEAKKIAEALGAEVSVLPEGETSPVGTEILIILGSDYVK